MSRRRQALAARIRERAAGKCEKCQQPSTYLQVVHLDQEPTNWTWANLKAMCSSCSADHNLEMHQRRQSSTSHAVRSWFGRFFR